MNEYECLQHLINELDTNNPLNSVEFVPFDNDIQTRGMADEEIVSIKNVLESSDNVFNFLVHPPADFNCDASTVSAVRSL